MKIQTLLLAATLLLIPHIAPAGPRSTSIRLMSSTRMGQRVKSNAPVPVCPASRPSISDKVLFAVRSWNPRTPTPT